MGNTCPELELACCQTEIEIERVLSVIYGKHFKIATDLGNSRQHWKQLRLSSAQIAYSM